MELMKALLFNHKQIKEQNKMYKNISEINNKYKTNYKTIFGYCNGLNFVKYLLNNKTLLKVNKTTKKEVFIKLNN